MPLSDQTTPCPACGEPVAQRHRRGRPRRYCDEACVTAAYRRRKRAADAEALARAAEALKALRAADYSLSSVPGHAARD